MLRLARWAAVTCVCHAFVARDYSSPLYSAQSAARRWAARSSRFGNSAEPRRATTTAEPPESRTADARSSRLLTRDGVLPVFIWPQRRGEWSLGGGAQAWLRHALPSLVRDLESCYDSQLTLRLAAPSSSLAGAAAQV